MAGLEPRWVQGRRYTDDATLAIVARVLAEEINEDIVRHIRKFGGRASGLHHKTTQCLFGTRITLPDADGQAPSDLGRVGEVTEVDAEPIINSCLAGIVPVLPSLAEDDRDEHSGLYNVNADTAAAAVAMALQGRKARLAHRTPRASSSTATTRTTLLPSLTPDDCRDLIARGVIDKGMIPKVEACLDSLEAGVKKAHVIDGRMSHSSLLVEMYTTTGVGTELVLNPSGRRSAISGQPGKGADPDALPVRRVAWSRRRIRGAVSSQQSANAVEIIESTFRPSSFC